MTRWFKGMSIALGIIGILGGGIWLVPKPPAADHGQRTASTLEPPEGMQEIHALRHTLVALGARLARLEDTLPDVLALYHRLAELEAAHRALAQTRASTPRRPPTGVPRDTPIIPPGQTEEDDAHESITHFETTFWSEPHDPVWSRDTEAGIAAVFAELDVPDTVLDELQCQQTVCRLELVHPEGRGRTTFIETVHTAAPFTNEFYAESMVGNDGQQRTLVYLARPGQSLVPPNNHP
jgi:hypothetical protein